jgi:hypothetical protein
MPKTTKKSIGELRRFGLVMTVPLVIIGGLQMWRERPSAPYWLALAALFFLSGILYPRLLAPIERGWMALAHRLSIVMTHVILTLTFYLIITPFGLLLQLLGKDLLQLKFEPARDSYWVPVEPNGPGSRSDKPY